LGHATEAATVTQLIDELARTMHLAGVPRSSAEASDIVAALYDVPRFWPMMNGSRVVEPTLHERAAIAAVARAKGAPLAYAVARAPFRHLTLAVDERVLIPRPETERLVDIILAETPASANAVVADVGTGSGAIAIALSTEGGDRFSRIYATDVSRDALDVASANIRQREAQLRAPIDVVHGAVLEPLAGIHPHVIVSNPPYIAMDESAALPSSVRDFEPAVALYGGADGMSVIRELVHQSGRCLAPGGLLAIEVDARRASLAVDLVDREQCFHSIRIELDLTGRERFVLARRQEERER
jgi:release factor glutamine methyltransferase